MLAISDRTLSLEPILRCPRCRKVFHASDQEYGRAFHTCQRGHCGQRWWAMVISAGAVEPQLEEVFDGAASWLMAAYGLPTEIPEPMFWQLPLTPHEVHLHRRASPLTMFRAVLLVPRSA